MSGPRLRQAILDIRPYVPGRGTIKGVAHPIKLSANENPLGSSAAARAAYLSGVDALQLYPDSRANRLREALAEKHGLPSEQLIFGCGSDEIFTLACTTILEPGDCTVEPQYGFAAWAIAARAAGAVVRRAPERNYTVDVDALLSAVDARARIVFVANPANPTGTYLPFGEIERLHRNLRGDVLLLLDEAYAEYGAGIDGFESGLSLARQADNILVTRTFSKAYGLASLRVGWAYGASDLIGAMERIRQPFNVSGPAEAAAVAALADGRFVEQTLAHVQKWRPRYVESLSLAGFAPIPSATNFVTFEVPPKSGWTSSTFETYLAERGFIVRGLRNYGMPDCLRITIGSDEESHAVLAHIARAGPEPGRRGFGPSL